MAAAALADINQCLHWIGFADVNQRNSIIDQAGLNTLRDLFDVSVVDIRDMAESFSKRSPANTRIIFGMRHIKWLIAMMHWAQDFKRCSLVPVLDDINNADEFKEVLQVAAQRATLRKTDTDQADTISKAADPGKFKDEKKWPDWEPAFVNYLSTIPGVEGVPLSYVVSANDAPDHQTDFGDDFISRSVAGAPLPGAAFRADARKVHQLLMNFLVAESAGQWIRVHVNQVNGRLDMVALRTHYSVIQFPPEMDENWVRYGLAKLGQISKLPNWQRMLFCAYTTQLLHSTGEVCWNNKDSYFILFEFCVQKLRTDSFQEVLEAVLFGIGVYLQMLTVGSFVGAQLG